MYVSHVAEDGRIEEVADHLREVAEMAAEFARPFGAESWAYAAGMAHDIGKYSAEFQNRILRDGRKVDHSTAGLMSYMSGPGCHCSASASRDTTEACPIADHWPNRMDRR